MPKHSKLSKEFLSAYNKGIAVIDTRNKFEFAEGFLPGSLNIQGNNSFSTWMGWLLDYQQQFILIAEDKTIVDLTRKLMRIGMDNMLGYVTDVSSFGIELEKSEVINCQNLKTQLITRLPNH